MKHLIFFVSLLSSIALFISHSNRPSKIENQKSGNEVVLLIKLGENEVFSSVSKSCNFFRS